MSLSDLYTFDISVVGLTAEPVSPAAPREEKGLYWGYTTRVAPSLKEALEQCPFEVSLISRDSFIST